MKKRYWAAIVIVVIALFIVFTYDINVPTPEEGRIIIAPKPVWTFSGAAFTLSSGHMVAVSGAKNTHTCLRENDDSCFIVTVRSGDYASYFRAYRTTIFQEMMAASGSTLTTGDMQLQIDAGFHEVVSVTGTNETTWHLVDIGLESQHLYIERPWGTLILTDALGLKGPSYEDRIYMPYTNLPQYILVQ